MSKNVCLGKENASKIFQFQGLDTVWNSSTRNRNEHLWQKSILGIPQKSQVTTPIVQPKTITYLQFEKDKQVIWSWLGIISSIQYQQMEWRLRTHQYLSRILLQNRKKHPTFWWIPNYTIPEQTLLYNKTACRGIYQKSQWSLFLGRTWNDKQWEKNNNL